MQNSFKIFFLVLLHWMMNTAALEPLIRNNKTSNISDDHKITINITDLQNKVSIPCVYAPGLIVGNKSRVLECCDEVVHYHIRNWYTGRVYLTYFLETLKSWKCPQYARQCKKRTFAFTNFDSLVYDRFCNITALTEKCGRKVFITANKNSDTNETSNNMVSKNEAGSKEKLKKWKIFSRFANFSSDDQLNDACVQVAIFDKHGGYGKYHEITQILIPFCNFVRCGYGSEILNKSHISTWSCMPIRCRVNNIIAMTIIACFSLVVVVANCTVIYVLSTYRNLSNSQSFYKASLAVADFLTGAIVFPSFFVNLSKIFFTRHILGDFQTIAGYSLNATKGGEWAITNTEVRTPGIRFKDQISPFYLNFSGFVTTVSLFVSLYTLMVASFDRFWAIYRPIKFKKGNSKKVAKQVCIFLWVLAIAIASIPFLIPGMKYGLISSVLVCFVGRQALILYAVAILVPLLVVWWTTIAVYVIAKKQSRRRLAMTRQGESRLTSRMEWRLTKTLSIMVLVFSLCLLPCILILIIPLFTYQNNIEKLDTTETSIYTSAEYITVIILMSNSLWNCIIYSLRHKEFRKATRESFSKLMRTLGVTYLATTMKNHRKNWSKIRTLSSSSPSNVDV